MARGIMSSGYPPIRPHVCGDSCEHVISSSNLAQTPTWTQG